MPEKISDMKVAAHVLNREGFLKWAAGRTLTDKDYKPTDG